MYILIKSQNCFFLTFSLRNGGWQMIHSGIKKAGNHLITGLGVYVDCIGASLEGGLLAGKLTTTLCLRQGYGFGLLPLPVIVYY